VGIKNVDMKNYFLLVLFSIFVSTLSSQDLTPQDLISKSIQYHDPSGLLMKKDVSMLFTGTRPGGEDSKTTIGFNIKKESFQMENVRDEMTITSSAIGDKVMMLVDGKEKYSNEIKEKYRLNPERVVMMKNYYQYLWLMPMKLNDPGTIIDPDVKRVDFFGKDLFQIKVSYSPEVGKDIWYFYFSPKNYAMQGYRFYHDESKNDGEYIILEDEAIFENVRLPQKRTWYTHKEDKLLGTDILDELSY